MRYTSMGGIGSPRRWARASRSHRSLTRPVVGRNRRSEERGGATGPTVGSHPVVCRPRPPPPPPPTGGADRAGRPRTPGGRGAAPAAAPAGGGGGGQPAALAPAPPRAPPRGGAQRRGARGLRPVGVLIRPLTVAPAPAEPGQAQSGHV